MIATAPDLGVLGTSRKHVPNSQGGTSPILTARETRGQSGAKRGGAELPKIGKALFVRGNGSRRAVQSRPGSGKGGTLPTGAGHLPT